MRAPVVYFAHPIDLTQGFASPHTVIAVREARGLLATAGAIVFDPATAFEMRSGLEPHDGLERVNRAALAQCDALVACFPESRSVGVAMEIEAARSAGLPILVVTSVAERSWSLAGISSVAQMNMQEARTLVSRAVALKAATGPAPMYVRMDTGDAWAPSRSYQGDAGYDLNASEELTVPVGQFRDVPCGISVQMPPGTWGMIQGRSSTLRTHKLLVVQGVIDNGYRGPLFVGVQNMGEAAFQVKVGMRLGQLIPMPLTADTMVPVETDDLDPSQRGTSGFGSSGE
jgi:dUTP pyrophosphatase